MKTVEDENIDAQSLAIVGVFGAIVAFVIIVGVQVLYYRLEKADTYVKMAEVGYAELNAMQTEQRASLNSYRWVDKSSSTVAIPIERAMERVVTELQIQR